MKASKADRAQDARIEAAYYAEAFGVQVDIMDIGGIFRALRAIDAAGGDLRQGVRQMVGPILKGASLDVAPWAREAAAARGLP